MVLRRGEEVWKLLAIDLPLFLAATVSVIVFYLVSQRAAGLSWGRCLLQVPMLMGLGIGLAINNSRAVLAGLWRDGGVFHRTPKFRIEGKIGGWTGKSYLLRKSPSFYVEAFLAFYFAACFVMAFELEMWLSVPFLYLFLHGYTYMFLLGIAPLERRKRLQAATAG